MWYAWAAESTWVTVVALAGDRRRSVSCGIAVGPRTTAVRTAFCRALHMRAVLGRPEYRRSLGPTEVARLMSVWHQGPEHIAYLEENAAGPDHGSYGDGDGEVDAWLDRATRRFGHEPVVLRSTDSSSDGPAVANVFCPGAAIYRRSSAPLPCPV